ncbi:MAG: TorD/DmsD family molecular chaperone, partial [Longimicrobiales bacterium]
MELFRALGALAEPPRPEHARLAHVLGLGEPPDEAAFTELFVLELPPFASIYTSDEGMLGGMARDRVAGFWRAIGRRVPTEPDHLTVLLGMYASLEEHEQSAERDERPDNPRWRHARTALFWEHLASWLPAYLMRVQEIAPPFYCAWAELLYASMRVTARGFGPPLAAPFHLREASPLTDFTVLKQDELIGVLLAPARSGLILTRRDHAAAARELGLGLRVGERRFALRYLLDQAPEPVLAWLQIEALRQAKLHRTAPDELQCV